MSELEPKPSLLRRFLGVLRRPSKRSLFSLLTVGFGAGIIFWGGFHWTLELTNTESFCISCHEMKDNVYQEYQQTVHFRNRTGVRATCPDCHVPREWQYKLPRKMQASKELWGANTGKVDTPEKFEAHRMEMATHEWARMEKAGSRECKNCHSWDGMATAKQRPRAQTQHAQAQKDGKTCIDCHKGIAHLLPKEYAEDEE
jgi:cytochrome c-type protein NapC